MVPEVSGSHDLHSHSHCATSSSNAQPQLDAAASMLLASFFSLAGYDVRIVDRTLGPGGGSIISKANGTSSYAATFNPAWICARRNERK